MTLSQLMKACSEPAHSGRRWSYRISGDTLEIHVYPHYDRDPELYRNSVLEAGSALQTLEEAALGRGYSLETRILPNLQEPGVVALSHYGRSISPPISTSPRLNPDPPPINTNGASPPTPPTGGEVVSLSGEVVSHLTYLSHLEDIASQQNLLLHNLRIEVPVPTIFGIMERAGFDGAVLQSRTCYALCSTTDNTFTWLETGRWLQRAGEISAHLPSADRLIFLSGLSNEEREGLAHPLGCRYVQVILLPDSEGVLVDKSGNRDEKTSMSHRRFS